ncbi:MAG: transposase [Saprospiraceae bacterium]
MADIHAQLYYHAVAAVQEKENLMAPAQLDSLTIFCKEWLQENKCRPYAVGGAADHLHLLYSAPSVMMPHMLLERWKTASRDFLREKETTPLPDFSWQTGYGLFSYSHSQVPALAAYIERQEEVHRSKSFEREYLDMLLKLEVDYEEGHLFTFY